MFGRFHNVGGTKNAHARAQQQQGFRMRPRRLQCVVRKPGAAETSPELTSEVQDARMQRMLAGFHRHLQAEAPHGGVTSHRRAT